VRWFWPFKKKSKICACGHHQCFHSYGGTCWYRFRDEGNNFSHFCACCQFIPGESEAPKQQDKELAELRKMIR
jgi:hypothetical protein